MTLVPYKGHNSSVSAPPFPSAPCHAASTPVRAATAGRDTHDPPPCRATAFCPLRVRPRSRRHWRGGGSPPSRADELPELDGRPPGRPGTALLVGTPGP